MSMLRNRLGFGRSKARAGHVSVLSTWTSARLSLLSPAAHGLCNRTSGQRQVTVELRCFKVRWAAAMSSKPGGSQPLGAMPAEGMSALRRHARSFLEHGIEQVLPNALVTKTVQREGDALRVNNQLVPLAHNAYLVGFGKAVGGMANVMQTLLADHLIEGVISVPQGTRQIAANMNRPAGVGVPRLKCSALWLHGPTVFAQKEANRLEEICSTFYRKMSPLSRRLFWKTTSRQMKGLQCFPMLSTATNTRGPPTCSAIPGANCRRANCRRAQPYLWSAAKLTTPPLQRAARVQRPSGFLRVYVTSLR
ncbi:hypothetical protein MTO96_049832 [Rhipicephalus appendiculatus]